MDSDVAAPASKIVSKPNARSKSILKNKASAFLSNVPAQT
jgi:hypothetical protein